MLWFCLSFRDYYLRSTCFHKVKDVIVCYIQFSKHFHHYILFDTPFTNEETKATDFLKITWIVRDRTKSQVNPFHTVVWPIRLSLKMLNIQWETHFNPLPKCTYIYINETEQKVIQSNLYPLQLCYYFLFYFIFLNADCIKMLTDNFINTGPSFSN